MKKYFRILAPFNSTEDVRVYKKAGADELYCGYISPELSRRWPAAFNIVNRRGEGQSFERFDDFQAAVAEAEKYRLPVYVTMNGLYTAPQYPFLMELVRQIESVRGVTGIIVADMGLILALKDEGFSKEIHVSTGGTCFNASAVGFYEDIGASRIILDRQLTCSEIRDIVTRVDPETDVELFILNEPCGGFIDGFCTLYHIFEQPHILMEKDGVVCRSAYNTELPPRGCDFYHIQKDLAVFDVATACPTGKKLSADKKRSDSFGCRICDLYRLRDCRIKSLKIVGRGKEQHIIRRSVEVVSQARSLLRDPALTPQQYRSKCKRILSKVMFDGAFKCTSADCYFSSRWARDA